MMLSVDFYKGFDEHFFYEISRSKDAQIYRDLLNQHGTDLEATLSDPRAVFGNDAVYQTLSRFGEENHGEVMHKSNEGISVTPDDLRHKAGLPTTGNSGPLARIECHLTRLIFPEKYVWKNQRKLLKEHQPSIDYSATFGIELLRYIPNVRGTPSEDNFFNTLNSEGQDTFLFWTLSPYLYLNLQERGLSSEQSLDKITKWVATPSSINKGLRYNLYTTATIRTHLSEATGSPLGLDERMPSHLKARLLAREVAQELVR